jgi:hypothetical protein
MGMNAVMAQLVNLEGMPFAILPLVMEDVAGIASSSQPERSAVLPLASAILKRLVLVTRAIVQMMRRRMMGRVVEMTARSSSARVDGARVGIYNVRSRLAEITRLYHPAITVPIPVSSPAPRLSLLAPALMPGPSWTGHPATGGSVRGAYVRALHGIMRMFGRGLIGTEHWSLVFRQVLGGFSFS